MRHVYLAATGQNRGKTTVSLGVLDGFQRRGLSTSFLSRSASARSSRTASRPTRTRS